MVYLVWDDRTKGGEPIRAAYASAEEATAQAEHENALTSERRKWHLEGEHGERLG